MMDGNGGRRNVDAQQYLHGYKKGHRLLAGSSPLSSETLRIIDRLSDASGYQPQRADEGYLTGYPLPDGNFALAMTWHTLDAPRPNVVATHTLVLPPSAMTVPTLQPLLNFFRRPGRMPDLSEYSTPIRLDGLNYAEPQPIAAIEPVRAVIEKLYGRSESAWMEVDADRNEICMAIWSQQWPRLRKNFTFCAAAIEPRVLNKRPFDLLLSPPGTRVGGRGSESVDRHITDALVEDLVKPGSLRKFLRSCGADTGRLRSVDLMTRSWVHSNMGSDPVSILSEVVEAAPAPRSLRRLKRNLLRGESSLLSNSDPTKVFGALSTGSIGLHIFAEDADFAEWGGRAWDHDREVVVEVAKSRDLVNRVDRETCAELAPSAARDLSLARSIPSELLWLTSKSPELATTILAQHSEAEWWCAWTDLPQDLQQALFPAVFACESNVVAACAALLARSEGQRVWSGLCGAEPQAASKGLILAIASAANPPLSTWSGTIDHRSVYLAQQITAGLPREALAAAADLAPYSPTISKIDFAYWKPLLGDKSLYKASPVRASVMFRAALLTADLAADQTVKDIYPLLYEAIATGAADEAWRVVEDILPGTADDWDRCHRLALGTAEVALGVGGSRPRPEIRPPIVEGAAWGAFDTACARIADRSRPRSPRRSIWPFH